MNKNYRIIALEELRFASSVLRETLKNEIKGISAKYLKIHCSGGIVHVLNAINKAEKCIGIHYMQFAGLYEHQEQRDSLIHALGADDFDGAMKKVRHLVERDTPKKPKYIRNFRDSGEKEGDCSVCGFGVYECWKCCPNCLNRIDWSEL